LTAGQLTRQTIQQRLDFQSGRSRINAGVDIFLLDLGQLQTKGQILAHFHVRIQRVVLEHHGNATFLRLQVVHYGLTDLYFATSDGFQTSNHTQQGGLGAAGRADQYHEFAILDVQIDTVNSLETVRVSLFYLVQEYVSHLSNPQ